MATNNNQVLLEVSNLKVAYGGIQAVKGASFQVRQGELVSLIGANGAGKTTTLKAITGTQPSADGSIRFSRAGYIETLQSTKSRDAVKAETLAARQRKA